MTQYTKKSLLQRLYLRVGQARSICTTYATEGEVNILSSFSSFLVVSHGKSDVVGPDLCEQEPMQDLRVLAEKDEIETCWGIITNWTAVSNH